MLAVYSYGISRQITYDVPALGASGALYSYTALYSLLFPRSTIYLLFIPVSVELFVMS